MPHTPVIGGGHKARRVWFFSPFMSIGTWRTEWPAMELARLGFDVKLVDPHSPAGLRERVEQVLEPADVVVLHVSNMIRSGLEGFVADMRRRVRYVLLQFDDDYTAHADVQIVRDSELLDDLIAGVRGCGGVIAATEEVAEVYRRWAPWVKVIPNRMPQALGAYHWTGTHVASAVYMAVLGPMDSQGIDPHFMDAASVADAIGDRPLHVLGGFDGTGEVFPHATYESPRDPDIRWPRRQTGRLYRRLAHYRASIAPLRPTRWNAAKSWIKPLEAATLGVPTVCSPSPAYERLSEVVPVWIARTPEAWGTMLDEWLGMEEGQWRKWSKVIREAAADQAIERHPEWAELVSNL